MLQDWLVSHDRSIAEYHWLCDRVSTWEDQRYVNRLTEEYVDRLLSLRQDGQALDVVAHRIDRDANFRPKTGAATLRIAGIAARGGGKPGVARVLLSDFGQRFAGDSTVAAAEALARDLAR
jgi:hypothetical protein